MADETKLQVIERIDEICGLLCDYEDRTDRAVELIVRADGSFCLMGEEETSALFAEEPETFEAIKECNSLGQLVAFLQGYPEEMADGKT